MLEDVFRSSDCSVAGAVFEGHIEKLHNLSVFVVKSNYFVGYMFCWAQHKFSMVRLKRSKEAFEKEV